MKGVEESPGAETGAFSASALATDERARLEGRQAPSAVSYHPDGRLLTSKQATSSQQMGLVDPQGQPELSEDFRNFTSQYGIPVMEKPKGFRSPEGPGPGPGVLSSL